MSVATRNKILTLSGAECFALLRAMATREHHLEVQLSNSELHQESGQIAHYMAGQLDDLRAVRAKFSTTPFTDGAL